MVCVQFCGDFEPMLDCLTVRTKSFAREADGTTPLMVPPPPLRNPLPIRENAQYKQAKMNILTYLHAYMTTGNPRHVWDERDGGREI